MSSHDLLASQDLILGWLEDHAERYTPTLRLIRELSGKMSTFELITALEVLRQNAVIEFKYAVSDTSGAILTPLVGSPREVPLFYDVNGYERKTGAKDVGQFVKLTASCHASKSGT
jgi:hypothetical protein